MLQSMQYKKRGGGDTLFAPGSRFRRRIANLTNKYFLQHLYLSKNYKKMFTIIIIFFKFKSAEWYKSEKYLLYCSCIIAIANDTCFTI